MIYWLYTTHTHLWRNQYVQAKLIDPSPSSLAQEYGPFGFHSPMQYEPYSTDLALTYQINPQHPHPDNYFENAGFTLHSTRLVNLMESFGVRVETFPVTMVDQHGDVQQGLTYAVFHVLEGILDAMDAEQSGWTEDRDAGIARLVLKPSNFEHRPIFVCEHIYLPLMRDDLKQAIQSQRITGFRFLKPERYCSGKHGFAPDFDD